MFTLAVHVYSDSMIIIYVNCMELPTAKSVGRLLDIRTARSPDAFGQALTQSIDGAYVEGISLTHGGNPHQHIWIVAASLDEVGSNPSLNCDSPCIRIET